MRYIFAKSTLYYSFTFSYSQKRNSKHFLYATVFRGGESQAYKIKPVLFLFVLCFLAAQNFIQNKRENEIYYVIYQQVSISYS